MSSPQCAELKAPADDRFDVFGDADRCSRIGDGRRRQSATHDERFARNALVRVDCASRVHRRRRAVPCRRGLRNRIPAPSRIATVKPLVQQAVSACSLVA